MKKLSLCKSCYSMTYTTEEGKCGKCSEMKSNEFSMKKFKALEEHACRFNDGDEVCDCFIEGYKAKSLLPMGVSQWRNHGKKYNYWNYFEKEIRNNILKKIKKWNESGYYSDCVGKHGWDELLNIIYD